MQKDGILVCDMICDSDFGCISGFGIGFGIGFGSTLLTFGCTLLIFGAGIALKFATGGLASKPEAVVSLPLVDILYHGSPLELNRLQPMKSPLLDGARVVFATPSRWAALVCASRVGSATLDFGYANGVPYLAEMYPNALAALRRPGYLYTVAAAGFHGDTRLIAVPFDELVRETPVDVASREHIPDLLAELRRTPHLRIITSDERIAFFEQMGVPWLRVRRPWRMVVA